MGLSGWDRADRIDALYERRYLRQGLPPLQGLAEPSSGRGIGQLTGATLQVLEQRDAAAPGQALDAPVGVRIE